MKLLDIPFDDARRRYLVFHPVNIPDRLHLASTSTTQAFEAAGSSRFYTSNDQRILAKVVPDKFFKRRAPLKWLLRDYLEKRWLLQTDARKEYLSLQILRRAGLQTPDCYGWGLSLNPGNRNGSLLLIEHIKQVRPGSDAFKDMNESNRHRFLDKLCQQLMQLAKAGYAHRDLHYNNLLISTNSEIIWIDTHVRPLPQNSAAQWASLVSSLIARKLEGEPYRKYIEKQLSELWGKHK